MNESRVAKVLVFGYGNLARGDDALGPRLVEALETLPLGPEARFDTLSEDQLQIEHVTDLRGRSLVLFIDAHAQLDQAFRLSRVFPEPLGGFSSHTLSPGALLAVHEAVFGAPPKAFVFAVQGHDFGLGAALSAPVKALWPELLKELQGLLDTPCFDGWSARCQGGQGPETAYGPSQQG